MKKRTMKLAAIILASSLLCSCTGGAKTASERHKLNAELSALSGEKLSFLTERAEYIDENGNLGTKVE